MANQYLGIYMQYSLGLAFPSCPLHTGAVPTVIHSTVTHVHLRRIIRSKQKSTSTPTKSTLLLYCTCSSTQNSTTIQFANQTDRQTSLRLMYSYLSALLLYEGTNHTIHAPHKSNVTASATKNQTFNDLANCRNITHHIPLDNHSTYAHFLLSFHLLFPTFLLSSVHFAIALWYGH